MKALLSAIAAAGLMMVAAPSQAQTQRAPESDLTIDAFLHAQNDVRISAEAEGILTKLPIKDGSKVKQGALLATIDDRQALAAMDVAKFSRDAARQRADDDIEERYAKAAAEVAYIDWQRDLQANQQKANAVPEIQIRQKKLVVVRSDLQIEKAKHDQLIAGSDAEVKEAELRAAEINLQRRTIKAPFDGEVQQLVLHESEWVNPGDPIMRLVQFDTLQADAYVSSSKFDPVDIAGRPVTIRVMLAHGEVSLTGHVIYVNQTVESNGDYSIRAEFENRQENGYWVVRPGLPARMTIHLNEPPINASAAE